MATSAPISPALLSDNDLRMLIEKETDARLQSEILQCQTFLDSNAVKSLPHDELVTHVVQLRKFAKTRSALRQFVTEFDDYLRAAKASTSAFTFPSTTATSVTLTQTTPVMTSSIAQQPVPASIDFNNILQVMMLQQQQREERDRKEKLEREEREAKREEKFRQQLLDQQERDRKDKRELQEELNQKLLDQIERDSKLRVEQEDRTRALINELKNSNQHDGLTPAVLDNSYSARLKRASDILKEVIPMMTSTKDSLPQYLSYVDSLFNDNKIDEDLRKSLLIPHLTEEARRRIQSLSSETIDTYEKFKRALMHEYKFTKQQMRDNFYHATRDIGESCTQFVTRLRAALKYYLGSCKVDSFEKLTDLMVSDRLKDTLSFSVKHYIADRERDSSTNSEKLIELIDNFEDSRSTSGFRQEGKQYESANRYNAPSYNPGNYLLSSPNSLRRNQRRPYCNYCNKDNHWESSCYIKNPQLQPVGRIINRSTPKDSQQSDRRGSTKPGTVCYTCREEGHITPDCPQRKSTTTNNNHHNNKSTTRSVHHVSVANPDSESHSRSQSPVKINKIICSSECNDAQLTAISESFINNDNNIVKDNIRVSPLMTVNVNFGKGFTTCIVDSGAEISVLKSTMLPDNFMSDELFGVWRTVKLEGPFGDCSEAKLLRIDARLKGDDCNDITYYSNQICCAITDKLKGDCALLTRADYDTLLSSCNYEPKYDNVLEKPVGLNECLIQNDVVSSVLNVSVDKNNNFGNVNLSTELQRISRNVDFRRAQDDDVSIAKCKHRNSISMPWLDSRPIFSGVSRKTRVNYQESGGGVKDIDNYSHR